ncbi:unnamed protein product [Miscanthus lutarioriparius]|uniref:Uncharacterized protein n=1 Tax=Miscanthus lutarioriparius TaxID=422564 RepID=A0A811QD86_9POAL|nr:unnamed protein product [Miscanthus lutarioriparius]
MVLFLSVYWVIGFYSCTFQKLKMKEREAPSMRYGLCELFNLAKEASKLMIIWCPTRRFYLG